LNASSDQSRRAVPGLTAWRRRLPPKV
jgi:hypothetical protein